MATKTYVDKLEIYVTGLKAAKMPDPVVDVLHDGWKRNNLRLQQGQIGAWMVRWPGLKEGKKPQPFDLFDNKDINYPSNDNPTKLNDGEWASFYSDWMGIFRTMKANQHQMKYDLMLMRPGGKEGTKWWDDDNSDLNKPFGSFNGKPIQAQLQKLADFLNFKKNPNAWKLLHNQAKGYGIQAPPFHNNAADTKTFLQRLDTAAKTGTFTLEFRGEISKVTNYLEAFDQYENAKENGIERPRAKLGFDLGELNNSLFQEVIPPERLEAFKRMVPELMEWLRDTPNIQGQVKEYGKADGMLAIVNAANDWLNYDNPVGKDGKPNRDFVYGSNEKFTDQKNWREQAALKFRELDRDYGLAFWKDRANRWPFLEPHALPCVEAILDHGWRPTDGLEKMVKDKDKILDRIEGDYRSPFSRFKMSGAFEILELLQKSMPSAFKGAMYDSAQLRALVAEAIKIGIKNNDDEKIIVLMEVLACLRYGVFDSAFMAEVGKALEEQKILAGIPSAKDKPELQFMFKLADKGIKTTILAAGWGINALVVRPIKDKNLYFAGGKNETKRLMPTYKVLFEDKKLTAEQLAKVQEEIDRLKSDPDYDDELAQKYAKLDDEIQKEEGRLAQKRQELISLRESNRGYGNQYGSTDLYNIQESDRKDQSIIDEMNTQRSALVAAEKKFEKDTAAFEKYEKDIKTAKEEQSKYTKLLSVAQSEQRQLENQASAQDTVLRQLQEKDKENAEAIKKLEAEVKEMKTDGATKEEIDKKNTEIKKAKEEKKKSADKVEKADQDKKKLDKDLATKNTQVADYTDKLAIASGEHQELANQRVEKPDNEQIIEIKNFVEDEKNKKKEKDAIEGIKGRADKRLRLEKEEESGESGRGEIEKQLLKEIREIKNKLGDRAGGFIYDDNGEVVAEKDEHGEPKKDAEGKTIGVKYKNSSGLYLQRDFYNGIIHAVNENGEIERREIRQKRRKVVDAEGNPILDEHGNQKFQGIGEWNAEHRKNKVLPKELLLSERKLKASDAETAMDRFRGYMARWDYLCNPWNQNWVPWKSRKKFIEERSPDGLSAEPKHMRGQTNDSGETDIGFRNDKGEWQDKGGTPEQHKYNEFFAHYDINIWGR